MDRDELQFDVKLALWRHRKSFPKSGSIDDFGAYARRVIESLERSLTFVKKQALKAHGTPGPLSQRDGDTDGPQEPDPP